MKRTVLLLSLAVAFLGVSASAVDNPHMGTWKLDEAKSKFAPGAAKNHTVVYEPAGDDIKVTVDGTDGSGNPTHNEWTGKFDGKFYAVSGDPTSDMRAYRKISKRKMALTIQKDGKVTITGTIAVSPNGKMRTVTTTTKNAEGKWVTNRAVYTKVSQ